MNKLSIPDLCVGDKIVRLTILEIIPGYRKKGLKKVNRKVKCLCECGNITLPFYHSVKIGKTKSCGCLDGEYHGMTGSSEYHSWSAMRQRCYNKNYRAFKDYGGRGITVCHRWQSSFNNFLNDMGKKPSEEYSLDRINNDGNYEPSNCQWSTYLEQANNRRSRMRSIIKCIKCKKIISVKLSCKSQKYCSRACRYSKDL